MKYVDGYVIVVKKGKLSEYKKMAVMGGKTWKKFGALEYFECVGDDLSPIMGGVKSPTFPKMVKAKPGEKIIFSFVVFKNKTHRDAVNKKVQAEMGSDDSMEEMLKVIDMKRFAYGGFKVLVEK